MKRVVEPAAGGKPVAVGPRLERPRDDPAQPAREEERERARRCDAEGGLGRDDAGSARRSTADRDRGHGQDDERHEPHQAVDQHRGDRFGSVVGTAAELHGADGVPADRRGQELAGEERDEVRPREPGERDVDALGREQEPPPERHDRHRGDADGHGGNEPAKLCLRELVEDAVDPRPVEDRGEQDDRDERLERHACSPAHRPTSAYAACTLRSAVIASSMSASE